MNRKIIILIVSALFVTACDGIPYKVTVEYAPDEYTYECYDCEEEVYNPNLVDPYSEDTNWYIDELGNIIWKK